MKSFSSTFWCGLVFVAFAALGIWALRSGALSAQSAGAFIFMFGGAAVLMIVWEVGRHFQGVGARWQFVQWGSAPRRVYLLRGSGLQVVLVVLLFLILGTGALLSARSAGEIADRWQMVLLGVAAIVAAIVYAIQGGVRPRGIAPTPEGLLWLKERASVLVPWDCIESIAFVRIPRDVGYGLKMHEPSLGVRLKPDALTNLREIGGASPALSRTTRSQLTKNRIDNNHELIYSADELIAPCSHVAQLLLYFLMNPRCRARLAEGEINADLLDEIGAV